MKISIQYVPNNLLNTILPVLSDGKIVWENTGSIVVFNPMTTSTSTSTLSGNWRESRLVSTSSGMLVERIFRECLFS